MSNNISYNLNGKYGIDKQVILSKEDYEKINGKSLCCNSSGYVMIWADGKAQYLHRWLFNLKTGDKEVVDHIDGNKLNATRENLRLCTISENLQNRKSYTGTSKYKGVRVVLKNGKAKYSAVAKKDNKTYCLGCFETENEAAEAYNIKTKELYNNFALLNIIE